MNRTSIRRQLLRTSQRALHYFGIASLYTRLARRSGFLALMYHSVPDATRAPFVDPRHTIPVDLFEEQLSLLKDNCSVVSLKDAVEYHAGVRELPENAIVITFDDGYLDNYEVAAPLLAKYQFPATLFVCTGYVDRQEPQWVDELYSVFRFRQASSLTLSEYQTTFDLESDRCEREAYQFICGKLLTQEYVKRRNLLDEVKRQLKPMREAPSLTLGWEHLRAMRREYPAIELGLHTHDHVDLTQMPVEKAVSEVRTAQQLFRHQMGYEARYLTYPYGRILKQLTQHLPRLGIDAAFVTQPTDRVTPDADIFTLPRYEVTRSLLDLRMWSSGSLPDLGRVLFGRVAD